MVWAIRIAIVWVIILTFAFPMIGTAFSQSMPQTLDLPKNAREKESYFRERLLRIAYNYRVKQTGEVRSTRGTAFLVSPSGYAVTTRHVLAPYLSSDNEPVGPMVIERAEGSALIPVTLVPNSIESSKQDISIFRVKNESQADFTKYLCVDHSNGPAPMPGKVLVAAWRYTGPPYREWQFVFYESEVHQRHGPGNLFEYWALTKPFENSMSGGAIVKDGQVAAVISLALEIGGRPIEGGYFANLLRFAKDAGWEGKAEKCAPHIPEQKSFLRLFDQREYYTRTCEGTLAWRPAGTEEYWAVPTNGNYVIRTDDLKCDPNVCADCSSESEAKTVRLALNHSSAQSAGVKCETDPLISLPTGAPTYFGVQVVPMFKPELLDVQDIASWFYRNSSLSRRHIRGHFSGSTAGPRKFRVPEPPTRFNTVTRTSVPEAAEISSQCRRMPEEECGDILALGKFDKWTGKARQWHGYPRQRPMPKSTLADNYSRESWVVPKKWLKQDTQVKNWIVKYTATTQPTSSMPVDVAFCVNRNWDGFFARAFSLERGALSKSVRIFLQ